ncbi:MULTISPECIES: FecR domain-containing protein [Chromobacterium]|uniref:LysM peptidoglycan-binding domain-containing protein n=1 Tax=Chromobacterium rhizoryzae TaxID=1778675 RepID=A0AAD0W9W2_9NEIS|nr:MULTISPECIES: FecR domain-containing protein [Chromobacterium]AXT47228.1 LysM peptidoglycan-binding domain-containing protein [Chromobacterium rhizoryzae]MDH0344232.1 FecR domain-containing protein [Chromobacterium haemolyticum]
MRNLILATGCFASTLALAGDPADKAIWEYTVKNGDNLWSLAAEHLSSPAYVPKLQARNRIANPYRLIPGSTLRVPYPWIKQAQSDATLEEMSGESAAVDAKGKLLELAVGKKYPKGTRFTTGNDAMIKLRFVDGSSLVINANTDLSLQTQVYYPSTGAIQSQIKLNNGSTGNSVIPNILMPSRYEIRTPSAVTTVRGTEFRVNASGGEDTLAEVLKGSVEVKGRRSKVDVPAGFGTLSSRKNGPSQPEELPPPPDLSTVAENSQFNPPPLEWQRDERAMSYRVTLSGKKRLAERQLQTPRYYPRLPGNGDYVLKVRAKNRSGLEGYDSTRSFKLQAYPLPPLLFTRADGAQLRGKSLPLRVDASPERPLRLQISRQPDFAQPLLEQTLTEAEFKAELPESGIWYWRLARLDSHGQPGPFSAAQKVESKGWLSRLDNTTPVLAARPYPVARARYTLTLTQAQAANANTPPFSLSSDRPQWELKALEALPAGQYKATVKVEGEHGYLATEEQEMLTLPGKLP